MASFEIGGASSSSIYLSEWTALTGKEKIAPFNFFSPAVNSEIEAVNVHPVPVPRTSVTCAASL